MDTLGGGGAINEGNVICMHAKGWEGGMVVNEDVLDSVQPKHIMQMV